MRKFLASFKFSLFALAFAAIVCSGSAAMAADLPQNVEHHHGGGHGGPCGGPYGGPWR